MRSLYIVSFILNLSSTKHVYRKSFLVLSAVGLRTVALTFHRHAYTAYCRLEQYMKYLSSTTKHSRKTYKAKNIHRIIVKARSLLWRLLRNLNIPRLIMCHGSILNRDVKLRTGHYITCYTVRRKSISSSVYMFCTC